MKAWWPVANAAITGILNNEEQVMTGGKIGAVVLTQVIL